MVTEDGILPNTGFPRPHGLKEFPKMRAEIVIVVALETEALGRGFLTGFGIVFGMPLVI